jgi:membrane protein required for colicin V production
MIENFSVEWLLFVPLIYGLVKGWMRGFVREVIGLVSLLLALAAAFLFHDSAYHLIEEQTQESGQIIHVVTYVSVFLLVMIGLNWLGKLLTKVIESAQLGTINRLLGALFSSLKWAIVLAILIQFSFLLNQRFNWFDSSKTTSEYIVLHRFQMAGEWLTQGLNEWWEKERPKDQFKTASIPGSDFPSRYSSMAPPPVET